MEPIIERKITYDGTIVNHPCRLLKVEDCKITLLHKIEYSFSMMIEQREVIVRKGSVTFAYYWLDRPYNLYFWRDNEGRYIGAYFNIVKNTVFTERQLSFEDLIIDIFVFPNGKHVILDENELPQPLEQFEGGFVLQSLHSLYNEMDQLIENAALETAPLFKKYASYSL